MRKINKLYDNRKFQIRPAERVCEDMEKEVKQIVNLAECEIPDEGKPSRAYFYHIDRESFYNFINHLKN
jgi:hypothetical protein